MIFVKKPKRGNFVEYFILFLSVACIAGQFNINKVYQKKFVHGLTDMLFFPFMCGVVNVVFFYLLGFCLYGKSPDFSNFSFLMAIILACVSTLSSIVGIMIMKYGRISIYSVFMMLGGMILPYFYGVVMLSETISAARIAGLVILVCALPLSVIPKKGGENNKVHISTKNYYILCLIIFCLNGMVSIISKTHSINSSAIPAENFIFYVNLWQTGINGAVYFILTIFKRGVNKSEKQENLRQVTYNKIHAILIITIYAVVSGIGFLFQLISAKTVSAVALYPFVTGGSIVLSTLGARIFFKEKIGAHSLAGIIFSFVGTLLFLF
jgi:drug/metabolite transporter (DMT)-like permease